MTTERDATRAVRSWLEDGVTALPDRVLDAVLDQLPRTHQRRAVWRLGSRPSAPMRRLVALAAAVVVAAGVVLNVVPGGGPGSPVRETPTAPASPDPTVELVSRTISDFPVDVTVEVPSGWQDCTLTPVEAGFCEAPDGSRGIGVSFLIVDNVVADPCDPVGTLLDPPPGPGVDDLVAAISSLAGFTASPARSIRMDGYRGMEFTIIAPRAGGCDLLTWATADRANGVSAEERNLLRIVDVAGTRVVVAGPYYPEATADDVATIAEVMDSVDFEP